ncbi:MAG TPA: 4-hydroxythreonine-4-phosphate dehydrogenase PdxA [Blastocatellia bacterium]|nr:4-hydroxythreonine-4-phosphate dehydrogenase PdxA [Blastocatellia bacterium]
MTPSSTSPGRPRVGITTGDPAGIGPEIVLKSVAGREVRATARAVILSDAGELKRQASRLGLPCPYRVVSEGDLASFPEEDVLICDTAGPPEPAEWGKVSAASGRAALSSIERGARLCLAGTLDALATAPINKEAIRLAGSPHPGHTEMLAELCGSEESLMCFFAGGLRVVLLTVHLSLSDAIKAITRERVASALALTDREMRRFGMSDPRIAVAGLNPHAGEHGLFGREEIEHIAPAIEECRARGIPVSGPFPSDTLFVRAARGEFDTVVACYHDQGLIAVKCLSFGESVNVTLGLPIIRTSVDHGTAFDIAGLSVADHNSMVEAIKLAAHLAAAARH